MPAIPWSIAVPPEVYTEYCGVTMRAYHSDPAVQMDVQLHGPQIMHERYGLPLSRRAADGAQTMLVELCRGVPEANIRAFIEVAKEYE